MKAIKIKPTRTTPAVLLDPSRGVLKMVGRSTPENSIDFYYPINSMLKDNVTSRKFEVRIKLEYFNTSSSKCLYDLFKSIKALGIKGIQVYVHWYYQPEDEDMLEVGEDYSDMLDMPFSFIEYCPSLSA